MNPVVIRFTGGMNNNDTALQLFMNEKGETQSLINADTTYRGRLKLLRPLSAINSSAESSSVHSIFRAQNKVLVGTGTTLKYVNGTALTSLLSGLSGDKISFYDAGNWVFLGDGTNKKAVYLGTPVGTDWGQSPPSIAPTVAVGVAGNPNGTYSCYYRYKVTLPDDSVIYTSLSPVGTVVAAANKIEWSALVHCSFVGAKTNAIELFRTKTGFAGTYLVAEVASGATTYSDDISDATLQGNTAYDEDGYYPPPSGVDIALYHPGADRMFVAAGNNIYWSEPGLYHIFIYDEASDLYTNTNSVFLDGENITSLIMWDEQLYIGSQGKWHRLRGYNPDYWIWEPTSAVKGPISWQSVAVTPFGAVYPGNDGYIWLFNGFESRKIAEQFVFGTNPTASNSHATFDGRYFRLFYDDSTYPELVLDFSSMPDAPPKVVQGTRTATASHYDRKSNSFYLGDSGGYVRSGSDTSREVAISFKTCEVPTDQVVKLSDVAVLIVEANTGGNNLVITPYQDNKAQDSLEPVVTTSMERVAVPLPLNTYRALSFEANITGNEEIELQEPWFLSKEEDS